MPPHVCKETTIFVRPLTSLCSLTLRECLSALTIQTTEETKISEADGSEMITNLEKRQTDFV